MADTFEISVNKKYLLDSLNKVNKAISNKPSVPILVGVKMEATANDLVMTGCDGDIAIQEKIPKNDDSELNIKKTGSVVLPAEFLTKIVKSLPGQNIILKNNPKTMVTDIISGQSHFQENALKSSDYVNLPKLDQAHNVVLNATEINSVIDLTSYATSSDASRPILTGVHLTLNNGTLSAVGTDSHRLSSYQLKVGKTDKDNDFDVIIPAKSLNELSSLLTDSKQVVLKISENQIMFTFDGTTFYSRLLEGNYPDVTQILQQTMKATTSSVCEADTLASTIQRASILVHNSHSYEVQMKLFPSNNNLVISSNSADVGKTSETVSGDDISGKPLTIAFNPSYMSDALKPLGDTKVKINYTNPLAPMAITPVENGKSKFIQIVTPIRTY